MILWQGSMRILARIHAVFFSRIHENRYRYPLRYGTYLARIHQYLLGLIWDDNMVCWDPSIPRDHEFLYRGTIRYLRTVPRYSRVRYLFISWFTRIHDYGCSVPVGS